MNQELKNELCNYLGELMAESEQTFDWIEKDRITEKINAVNLLLGFTDRKETWMEKLKKIITHPIK